MFSCIDTWNHLYLSIITSRILTSPSQLNATNADAEQIYRQKRVNHLKLGDEYLKFINPNSKCINLPNTIENQQIIKTLRNWKPELISQNEEINEGDSIKIKRDQKLWNGFFKQGE